MEIDYYFIMIDDIQCDTKFSIEAERWRLSGKEVFIKLENGEVVPYIFEN